MNKRHIVAHYKTDPSELLRGPACIQIRRRRFKENCWPWAEEGVQG